MIQSALKLLLALSVVGSIHGGERFNIHLPLLVDSVSVPEVSPMLESAMTANKVLRDASETEDINFETEHNPHVTLFLSEFDETKLDEILAAIEDVAARHAPCRVEWPEDPPRLSMAYTMYGNPITPALQALCDDLVETLQDFVHQPQYVPVWIDGVPEPHKSRKKEYILKYGSPNVKDEYEPHVTIGFDTKTDVEARKATLARNFPNRMVFTTLGYVAIGKVGVGGSVVKGSVFKEFPLLKEEPDL